MTNEQALNKLDETLIGNLKWKMVLSKALGKQIPKKPTPHIVNVERLKIGNANWGKGTTVYKCPCCNNFISRLYDYCYKCGQAIDWEVIIKND